MVCDGMRCHIFVTQMYKRVDVVGCTNSFGDYPDVCIRARRISFVQMLQTRLGFAKW
jgi:hypothetical protein